MDDQPQKYRSKFPGYLSIIFLVLAYAIAFGFDTALRYYRDYAGATFNMRPALVLNLIFPILVVGIVLGLAWLTLSYTPSNRITALFFTLTGMFLIGDYLTHFKLIDFPFWLRATISGRFRLAVMDFGFPSSLYLVGTGSIYIGLAAFWRARKQNNNLVEES